jgi:hypothetical protein
VSPRATKAALAGTACAVLASAGCTSFSLRASEARMPILLGPVACIGCAPEPGRGAAPPTVTGSVHEREYVIAQMDGIRRDTAPLDVAATKAVPDPCREDLHVSRIHSGAWFLQVVPLLIGFGNAWVEVQASRAVVPNGTCGPTPWPNSEPAGIVGVAPEQPRDRRRP